VERIRDPVLDTLAGLGTGRLREQYDAIVKGGGRFYLSGMSSSARGVSAADLQGKPAEFAQPAVLVRLSLEHDRLFTYRSSSSFSPDSQRPARQAPAP
jgi:hypothetical protein